MLSPFHDQIQLLFLHIRLNLLHTPSIKSLDQQLTQLSAV